MAMKLSALDFCVCPPIVGCPTPLFYVIHNVKQIQIATGRVKGWASSSPHYCPRDLKTEILHNEACQRRYRAGT